MARPLQSDGLVRLLGVSCALAIGLAGCGVDSLLTGTGCVSHDEDTWDLHEPTDPATTLKIEDCRVDVDACDALCTMVLAANNSSGTETSCQVTFEGATTHVDIHYDVNNGGDGCAVPEDDEPAPSGGGGGL